MSSSLQSPPHPTPPRPKFMVTLGLLPPYSADDVKQAYLTKVKAAHPDRGGSPALFAQLETAYQQALHYVRFHTDRRGWIATHVDQYVAQQTRLESLRRLGAEVETESIDWLRRSFGDFADLTERVAAIRLPGRANAAEIIDVVVGEHPVLTGLKELDLADCPIDDELVFELRVLRTLVHLDLSRTPITARALGIVHWLPGLQSLEVQGTSIGWWRRSSTTRFLRRRARRTGAVDPVVHPANIR